MIDADIHILTPFEGIPWAKAMFRISGNDNGGLEAGQGTVSWR